MDNNKQRREERARKSKDVEDKLPGLVNRYITEGLGTDRDLSDELMVSRPTIERWGRGTNLPAPNIGMNIIKWLETELDTKKVST